MYRKQVRPLEYRCLTAAAVQNIGCCTSTVVDAPFVQEFSDEAWLTRIRNACAARNAELSIVWASCDIESMRDYLQFRDAPRDAWKLANWPEHTATVDPAFAPPVPHYVANSNLNATTCIADQVRELAIRMRRAS